MSLARGMYGTALPLRLRRSVSLAGSFLRSRTSEDGEMGRNERRVQHTKAGVGVLQTQVIWWRNRQVGAPPNATNAY